MKSAFRDNHFLELSFLFLDSPKSTAQASRSHMEPPRLPREALKEKRGGILANHTLPFWEKCKLTPQTFWESSYSLTAITILQGYYSPSRGNIVTPCVQPEFKVMLLDWDARRMELSLKSD